MNRDTVSIFLSILIFFLFIGFSSSNETYAQSPSTGPLEKSALGTEVSYIDAHNHLAGGPDWRSDYPGAARSALFEMDKLGIRKIFIMPPPFSPGQRGLYDLEELLPVAGKYPDRFAVLGGGGSLNVMIHQVGISGFVSPDIKARFEKKATEIISTGAVGFGEFAAEHFSFNYDHPYESVPADHPLFLLLADLAAKFNVPVDIHMEAIPKDMPLPDRSLLKKSGNNPNVLRETYRPLKDYSAII